MTRYSADRRLTAVSAGIYALGVALGAALWMLVTPDQLATVQPAADRGVATVTEPSTLRLLSNNVRVVAVLLSGALTFGATTFLTLVFNGLTHVTVVLSLAASPLEVAVVMGPHGVFELPAYFLAGAAAFRVPYEFCRYLVGRQSSFLTRDLAWGLARLVLGAVVLVVVGAWVEATVTPALADALL